MAKEWAVSGTRDGYANEYRLDTSGLNLLDLCSDEYHILHWLTKLLQNRVFDIQSDFGEEARWYLLHNFDVEYQYYDIIMGYRADDSYFSFAQDFLNNAISLKQLSRAMHLGELGVQIVLKSQKAFDQFVFQKAEIAEAMIWQPKKMERDRKARRDYYLNRNEPWKRGEIYMLQILEEEMMHAYDELYLGKARTTLAWMFDYGINCCDLDVEPFYRMFLTSSYVHRFENGDCSVVAGLSGGELAQRVISEVIGTIEFPEPIFALDRSPEYWLGFYLAYYQWYRNVLFEQITVKVPVTDILLMYRKYHEMDMTNFVYALDKLQETTEERQMSRLQEYRRRIGLSQRELSERADVPLRTIQQYEQKQKNINHARAEYVIRIA